MITLITQHNVFLLFNGVITTLSRGRTVYSGWLQGLALYRLCDIQGRIQDFKLGGVHLKELRRAEGGAKFFGVFRVKNHDFTPKNHIFDIERKILYGTHLNENTFFSSFNICLITGFSTFFLLYFCTIFARLILLQKTSAPMILWCRTHLGFYDVEHT
jgi:hypothetical protein